LQDDVNVKASPDRTVEKFRVVSSSDDYHVGSEAVKVPEHGRDEALDFATFVFITAKLGNRIKFIKKEDAMLSRNAFDQMVDPPRSIAK